MSFSCVDAENTTCIPRHLRAVDHHRLDHFSLARCVTRTVYKRELSIVYSQRLSGRKYSSTSLFLSWTIQTCWRAPYGNGEYYQPLFERSWETTFYRLTQKSGWDELVPPGTELSMLQAPRAEVVRGIEEVGPRLPPGSPGGIALARTKANLLGRLDTRIALRRGCRTTPGSPATRSSQRSASTCDSTTTSAVSGAV